VLGERFASGETVFETDAVRMWHDGDGIAVLGFKTKMNTISDGVLAGIQQAVDAAEKDFQGLVLWQPKEPFSLGADLTGALGSLQAGRFDEFEKMVETFQATPCASSTRWCRWWRRCAAWRSAAAANSRCIRPGPCSRWRATPAWSRPAWACCPPAAA
jgi:hypothetical protein